MQVCPAFMVKACQSLAAAFAGSASASTMAVSAPLSSSTVGVSVPAAAAATRSPVAHPPVKTILSKPPSDTRRSPSARDASAISSQSAGSPQDAARRMSSIWDRGDRSEGFTVTRLPATTACTSCTPSSPTG